MNRNFLLSAVLLAGLAGGAEAQPSSLLQNTLTNHDIVVLAQAGFNENFIIDLISMSRTRFDTTVVGLSDLLKEGLTERLIRAMLSTTETPQTGIAPGAGSGGMAPAATIGPPVEIGNPRRAAKQSEGAMAISSQAPYYRTSSILWGLWKWKTGVGAGVRSDQPLGVQLGTAYGQVQMMSPAGVPARYVLLP
jgi:hypothetical protein